MKIFIASLAAVLSITATARSFEFKADRIAADNKTGAMVATGNVTAVSAPLQLKSEYAYRDAAGVVKLADPTEVTTCTNHPGICHWSLKGEVEYLNERYIAGRNLWLEFYEVPVAWIPYFYYPLDTEYGLRVMPGYTGRWGGYVMMKYVYHLIGDAKYGDDSAWLHANTRLDWRYKNGIAAGQTFHWNMPSFGKGHFKIYHAWDEDHDRYRDNWDNRRHWNYKNWGSRVPYNRFLTELGHRWELTERDVIRVMGTVSSDSNIRDDFFRNKSLSIRNDWYDHNGNEVAWERNEQWFGTGLSVSGPLNEFYDGVARLPEWHIDVMPINIPGTFLNYESETRVGYLARRYAEYGDGHDDDVFAHNPGLWARYTTFRMDSYHRLTAPFKVADIVSTVPRVAYRGTYWNATGDTIEDGWGSAGKNSAAYRSIFESGVTFAARGRGAIDDRWTHIVEPYFDVLAQQAWYDGVGGNKRPYYFDAIDASVDWEDQFAGRSRQLPYSYYGITPGFRNEFESTDEKGATRTFFDFDIYAALQFNGADWSDGNDNHKLARVGSPNYGKNDLYVMPGFRTRWTPADDVAMMSRLEYDPDRNRIAFADLEWRHKPSVDFSYYVRLSVRDYRRWDFSSSPYDNTVMTEDAFNYADSRYVAVGFEHQPIDWFAWSPFIRWDCRENEIDTVGSWFDYLTDCLGFRLIVEYENSYIRLDGSEHEDDWNIGFFIYLRALGADASNLMNL